MKRTHDSQPDGEWLADRLRRHAQGHDADLARITARFERLTDDEAAPGTPRRRAMGPMRVRLLGIPLGIAAVLASATVAVAVGVGIAVTATPRTVVPVTSPKTSQSATATIASANPPSPSSAPTEGATSPATTATGSAGSGGQLAATASVDAHSTQYWAQENLTVTPAKTISELRITVTVSGGSSVVSTGMWTTIVPASIETSATPVSGGLEYQVTLKPGQSLKPAVYRFGFQFNRPASGHDFALDTYHVTAVTTDGTVLTASGGL
ncbi:MAG TPA: hypothetical protein VFN97_02575 [Actinospica sp.]|nr:hypothetical protein [Actinospica sp.]